MKLVVIGTDTRLFHARVKFLAPNSFVEGDVNRFVLVGDPSAGEDWFLVRRVDVRFVSVQEERGD